MPRIELSISDSGAITDLVLKNKNQKQIIDLQKYIDFVTIEWLVKVIEHLLSKESSANEWQKLLTHTRPDFCTLEV